MKTVPAIIRPLIFSLLGMALALTSKEVLSQNATAEVAASPSTALCLTDDGQLVSGSDHGLQFHDPKTLNPTGRIESKIEKHFSIVASPDNRKIAVAGGMPSEMGVVEIFSLPKMKLLKRFSRFDDIATDVAWISNDGLVAASVTGNCCIFDLNSENSSPFNVHSKSILSIEVLRNKKIVSVGKDNSLRVWNAGSPNQARVLNNHIDIVTGVAVRPSPKAPTFEMIATVSNDSTVRFWQPTIGRMVRFARLESEPTSVIWASDGCHAIVACRDGKIVLVNAETARQKLVVQAKGLIYDMVLEADNSVIAAGDKGLQRLRFPVGDLQSKN